MSDGSYSVYSMQKDRGTTYTFCLIEVRQNGNIKASVELGLLVT